MRHNFERVVSLSVSGLSGNGVKTQTKQCIFPEQQEEEEERGKEILTALFDSATSTSRN